MPVSSVHIDASLVFFNLAYALATEREEVTTRADHQSPFLPVTALR